MKNPIEVWFDNPVLMESRGTSECMMGKSRCLSQTNLDPHTDELPPDWIIDVLTLTPLSYKGRAKVIIAHCENIAKAKGLTFKRSKPKTGGK